MTTLVVERQVPDEWADDMRGMWSEAINAIKRLAERVQADEFRAMSVAFGLCTYVRGAHPGDLLPSQNSPMGIRYYAYAFDSHQTARALADPLTVLGSDPLADALGLEPGFTEGVSDLRQSLPERDFLYLDKAWPYLQLLTGPGSADAGARAAYRMFEGAVTYRDGGCTWDPWVRALPPGEVVSIARDLESFGDHDVEARLAGLCGTRPWLDSELGYATDFFHRARAFVRGVAEEGRGFVYTIG